MLEIVNNSGIPVSAAKSFYNFDDSPFALCLIAYPLLEVVGSKGGWTGFSFKDYNRQFLIRADLQGIFSYQELPGWHWRFNNGVLDIGSVPWARLIDVPDLPDQNQGSWLPVLKGSVVAGNATYSTRIGEWTRVGSMSFCYFRVVATFTGASGNIQLTLPFPSRYGSVVLSSYSGIANNSTGLIMQVPANSTYMQFLWPSNSVLGAANFQSPCSVEGMATLII